MRERGVGVSKDRVLFAFHQSGTLPVVNQTSEQPLPPPSCPAVASVCPCSFTSLQRALEGTRLPAGVLVLSLHYSELWKGPGFLLVSLSFHFTTAGFGRDPASCWCPCSFSGMKQGV